MPIETAVIDTLITEASEKYGVNRDHFFKTLDCESEGFFDVRTQSFVPDPTGPNGREDSWGVAQIHLPDHLDITKAQAQDPEFAIPWAAQEFAAGNEQIFHCYAKEKANGWQ